MSAAFLTGFIGGASLIVAIGAQNAFVLRQGLTGHHIKPVIAFCCVSDIVLIAVGVYGLGAAEAVVPHLAFILRWIGIGFLAVYSVLSFKRALHPGVLNAEDADTPAGLRRTLLVMAGFTWLNPHVYMDTVLFLGSLAQQQPEDARVFFLIGASCASVLWFTSLGLGARRMAPMFAKPGSWRVVDTGIGVTMGIMAFKLLKGT